MLFNLTYGFFSLLIEVPRDNDNSSHTIDSIPFPPIIFHHGQELYIDLSETTQNPSILHSIVVSRENPRDITNQIDVSLKYDKKSKRMKRDVTYPAVTLKKPV